MPCSGDNYPSDKGVSIEKLQADAAERQNAKARKLLDWLLFRKLSPEDRPLDDVGRLCQLINDLGEEKFLNILKKHFDDPVARQLAGWWEDHKESDALRDERGE